ncbi:MAG: hypothetical protein CMO80_17485 [Verrucomicrobiales bacterium]|nr:hypothetical protein [Verrucomicrobiales bacterium]
MCTQLRLQKTTRPPVLWAGSRKTAGITQIGLWAVNEKAGVGKRMGQILQLRDRRNSRLQIPSLKLASSHKTKFHRLANDTGL